MAIDTRPPRLERELNSLELLRWARTRLTAGRWERQRPPGGAHLDDLVDELVQETQPMPLAARRRAMRLLQAALPPREERAALDLAGAQAALDRAVRMAEEEAEEEAHEDRPF